MGLDVYLRKAKPDFTIDDIRVKNEDNDFPYHSWKSMFDEYEHLKNSADEKHICNPGYLRSSYNASGCNGIARIALGTNGYYTIFGVEDSDGAFVVPNWALAKEVALSHAKNILEWDGFMAGQEYAVRKCESTKEFLAVFREERTKYLKREADSPAMNFSDYSSAMGFFAMKGMELYAVSVLSNGDATYVYKLDRETIVWYSNAFLAAAQMCDFVLKHKPSEQKQFFLYWSA